MHAPRRARLKALALAVAATVIACGPDPTCEERRAGRPEPFPRYTGALLRGRLVDLEDRAIEGARVWGIAVHPRGLGDTISVGDCVGRITGWTDTLETDDQGRFEGPLSQGVRPGRACVGVHVELPESGHREFHGDSVDLRGYQPGWTCPGELDTADVRIRIGPR